MKNKNEVSSFDKDTLERIRKDRKFAAVFFEDLSERPMAVQLSVLRRIRGASQESMASKLRRNQNYISKLEKPGSDHLLSNYEKAAKILHGRIAIIPEGSKIMPA